ncbi:hypothetical protein EGW08_009970 [Elysia chlorotica]|uniref:Uncharacterized protein n=1 Tax=Elysia chlorotica TaxID=188477 RepID=A0A433TKY9_ELYCH|nr:hypothetical protein EGW08_009970 [Elysia chlorotica]
MPPPLSAPSCEYGALRAAPPLPYPSLQDLPDMAETSIIVATSGPGNPHGGPPHQGPPSLSPGPVHHIPHHSLALTHASLQQHLATSNNNSGSGGGGGTSNGGLSSQHLSSTCSSVSSNGTLVVQPDGSTTTTTTATSTILTVRMIMQGKGDITLDACGSFNPAGAFIGVLLKALSLITSLSPCRPGCELRPLTACSGQEMARLSSWSLLLETGKQTDK